MTISINGATVETGATASTSVARTAAPLISAAGVRDAAAIARQQLPNAVPAPAPIAAYLASLPTLQKTLARANANTPSSALAAQWIAQNGSLTSADLELFSQHVPPPAAGVPEFAGDDFLTQLRIARGDQLPAPPQQTSAPVVAPSAALPTATTAESAGQHVLAPVAVALPALLTQWIRRLSFVQAQGVGAYQLAQARNGAIRTLPPAEKAL